MKYLFIASCCVLVAQGEQLFETSNNQMCRMICIDADHKFCPDRYGLKGVCCEQDDDTCPKTDICSSDAPSSSEALQYWTCPHDQHVCGESTKVPDGQGIEAKIISQYHDQFNWGAICRYKIDFPPMAAEYDRLVLKVNSLEFAQVTAV